MRDRVEAAFCEGVTTGKAAKGQPGAVDDAKSDECNVGVLRAGGEVEALGGTEGVEDGRQDGVVQPEGNADGEAGLGVWHRVRTNERTLGQSFAAAFAQQFGWRGRR
jgi:hypothetical protein